MNPKSILVLKSNETFFEKMSLNPIYKYEQKREICLYIVQNRS